MDFESFDMASALDDPEAFFEMIRRTYPDLPIPPSFPSPEEIRQKSKAYAKDIFSSWTMLRQILTRREEIIRKRWMKKTKEQRRKVLLASWPGMPARHRPDFEEFVKRGSHPASMNADLFKWPYINQEDLLNGRSLLLFLNSRGRNPPHVFAHADLETTHIGQTSKAIIPVFLNHYTMYIAGQLNQDSYGRLVSWDEDEDAFDLLHNCLQFQPGAGLLALELQSKVYAFLLECCYQIFQDIPRDELSSLELPEQPEPPAIVANETSYAQLASVAAEAPYRLPAVIDTHRMVLLLEARRGAAEDHVWDLREDPGYFASVTMDQAQHRQERLLDINGQRHPHDNDGLFWNRVIGNVLAEAYMGFLSWDLLYNCAVEFDKQFRATRNLDHRKSLPEKLETAFVELQFAVEMASKSIIETLKVGLPASPPMRERFVRDPQEPGTAKMRTGTKGPVGNDPLLRLFAMIWDERQSSLLRLPNLVDEVQRCIDHDPGQKNRVSSWVAMYFSDLALTAQLTRQVKMLYPPAPGLEQQISRKSRKPTHEKATEDAATIYLTLREDVRPNMAPLVVPLRKKLHYPIEKACNTTGAQVCRQAEIQLDKMWTMMDAHFLKHNETTLHEIFLMHTVAPRQIRRNPPWNPPNPTLFPKPRAEETLQRGFSSLRVGPEKPPRLEITESLHAKTKIRGTSQPSGSAAGNSLTAEQTTEGQVARIPTFTLARRAWRVFSTIFHDPSDNDHVGEIPWTDFLHAMTALGFAAEKLYGSAWQFKPSKLGVESSVQIHEPHPSGKIPFHTARRLGRQLFRTYGLTRESFKLA